LPASMYTRTMSKHNRRATGPTRAVVYGRVSTGRQADSGLGLADQDAQVRDLCARRGYEIVAEQVDAGISGRKARRPGLDAALAMLDAGEADVLVCAKTDRLARSTAALAALLDRAERHGWAVVLIDADVDSTTASGRLVVDLIGSVAAFESRRIGERVKAAHAQMRAQGRRAGQLPILPDEIRQRIADEHAAGRSMNAIAGELNAEGVPTAKGATWYASTVAHVLRSVDLERELANAGQGRAAIA